MIKKILLNSNICRLVIFLMAFIPRAILCFFAEPVAIISDEVATIAGGAYWAGLDWSAVVSHAGYYGSGMTAWTSIFFRMTDDPKIIYILITLFCTLIQSVTSLISYDILKKIFNIENSIFNIVVSVASSYLVMTASIVVFNEHGLILISWVCAWILLKLDESVKAGGKKKKMFYTLLLMIVLAYGLTLHTRVLMMWIALVITVILYAWIYKRFLISLPVSIIIGGIFYCLAKFYVQGIQEALWLVNSGTENVVGGLRNAEVTGILPALRNLLSPQSWQAWFNIILGQLHTIAVFTGGLFIVFIIIFIHFIWKKLWRKTLDEEKAGIERSMLLVIVFFAICIAGTIAGQSLMWLSGSIDVIKNGFDNNLYATKAYGYLRYFGPYCGPVFLMGAIYLYHWKKKIFDYKIPIVVSFIILEFYWLVCIVPYIYRTTQVGALEFYVPYSLENLYDTIGLRTIIPASVVLLVSIVLNTFWIKKDRLINVFVWTGCLFIYTYFYIGIVWNMEFSEQNKVLAQKSYELIREVEDEIDLPKEIYVDDSWKKYDHNNYYMYQILLNRYKIIPGIPDSTYEEVVFFTNDTYTEDNYEKWKKQGYNYYRIGEYELLLVKGEKLQSQFKNAGVPLK